MFTLETFRDQLLECRLHCFCASKYEGQTESLLTIDHFEADERFAVFINIGRGDLVEEVRSP